MLCRARCSVSDGCLWNRGPAGAAGCFGIVVGDKGHPSLANLIADGRNGDPYLAKHGSVSVSVNFHTFGALFDRHVAGGFALTPDPSPRWVVTLCVGACVCGCVWVCVGVGVRVRVAVCVNGVGGWRSTVSVKNCSCAVFEISHLSSYTPSVFVKDTCEMLQRFSFAPSRLALTDRTRSTRASMAPARLRCARH